MYLLQGMNIHLAVSTPESMHRVLLVEDDSELSALVAERLAGEGYRVEVVAEGPAALEAADRFDPDVVLLDIMLPGLDGLEVCRVLRARSPLLYIIMMTARSGEMDRIVGLEVGADDYVTKPFSLHELVARVRAAMRRVRLTREQAGRTDEEHTVLEYGDLRIDAEKREVHLKGEAVPLTLREFDLLLFLARNPDRPFTRAQLLSQVWDIEYEGYDRTVDSHIQRLRAKLEEDSGNPRYVRTVWGLGYKFSTAGS